MKLWTTLNKQKVWKTISYRLWASCLTLMVSFMATNGNVKATAMITGFDLVWKPLVYYVHELIWMPYERRKLARDSKKVG